MTSKGKLLPLADAVSVLTSSAVPVWQGFDGQHYRLHPTECPTYASSAYSFVLQLSSSVTIEWQSGGHSHKRQMNPGDVSLHSVGELPGFRLDQAVEIFEIVLMPQFVNQVLQGMRTIASPSLVSTYGVTDPQIQRIATALRVELEMGCPGGQLLGESLAIALTAHVFTQYGNQRQVEPHAHGLSSSDLRRVLAFIDAHLAQDLTLSTLASVTSLSPHYFALQFRRSIGVSPHQYVIQQRIETAKRLLLNSNTALAEVAGSIGFANQSHFNLHFKRLVGVTPGQYRRAAR